MFPDNKHEDKRFMAATIRKIQVACNFRHASKFYFLLLISICHSFKGIFRYLNAVILSCILLTN